MIFNKKESFQINTSYELRVNPNIPGVEWNNNDRDPNYLIQRATRSPDDKEALKSECEDSCDKDENCKGFFITDNSPNDDAKDSCILDVSNRRIDTRQNPQCYQPQDILQQHHL